MKVKVYNNESNVLEVEYSKNGDLDCDYDITCFELITNGDSITLIKLDSGEAVFSMRKGTTIIYVDLLKSGYTIELF